MPTKAQLEKASQPFIPMLSEASYEALLTGVGKNREYTYSSKEGFSDTENTEAVPNVYSTYALLQNNQATSKELIEYRAKNANEYITESKKMAAVIGSKMPKYFNKSSILGSVFDLGAFAAEGIANVEERTIAGFANLPDTLKSINNENALQATLNRADETSRKHVEYALMNVYAKARYTKDEKGNLVEMNDIRGANNFVARYKVDKMVADEKGTPLTPFEKDLIKAYQNAILTRRQDERNRLTDVWYDEMVENKIANGGFLWIKPGMGASTLRSIGNFAGEALASWYTFKVAGLLLPVSMAKAGQVGQQLGIGVYNKAWGAGRQSIKWSKLLGKLGSRVPAGVNPSAYYAQHPQEFARLLKAEKFYKINRARYNMYKGMGSFITKNFAGVMALSAISGKTGVFTQSFFMEFNDVRNKLLAQGADWETATGAAIAAGIMEGGIETMLGFRFVKKFLTQKRSFRNFLYRAVLPEGSEEALQTLSENLITKAVGFNSSKWADIGAEMLFSFIGGAIGGGLGGASEYGSLSDARLQVLADFEEARRRSEKFNKSSFPELLGKTLQDIENKYQKQREELNKKEGSERNAKRKEIEERWEKAKATRPDTAAQREKEWNDWLEERNKKWQEEESARKKQQRDEELKARADLEQKERLASEAEFEQNKLSSDSEDNSRIGFNAMEREILSEMKEIYEERARKVNPDINQKQLDTGWKAVQDAILYDGYTGAFTDAVSNSIDNMISFSDRTQTGVKKALEEHFKNFGLDTQRAKQAAAKLTSADAWEKYNAELDVMEQAIISDFALAGAKAQGELVAKVFRNQLGTLPLFALDDNGQQMTPLAFYQSVKPRIINVQNAIMQNQQLSNINNIMDKALQDFDTVKNYKREDGSYDYDKAFEKYLNLWNLIESYEDAEGDAKESILANINLLLFNAYNYTDDIDFIKKYIESRAAKEYAVIDEMGLDIGSEISSDMFNVLALMRQKNLPFSFCARAIGLVAATDSSISDADLDAKYEETLNDLYPPLGKEDIKWLNRIAAMQNPKNQKINESPKYREYTVDTSDKNRATYDRKPASMQQSEEDDVSAEKARKDIEEEEGYVLEPKDTPYITYTEANQKAWDEAHFSETGETSNFIVPNALYSRKGRVILVINGKDQGEFVHEGGHYLITEFFLQNQELGALVGDEALGSVNKLLIELYTAATGNSNVRLSPIAKQETILDALMDFIRTDGHTGNEQVDEIITRLQQELNDVILHPEGSAYSKLPAEKQSMLREAVKNMLTPSMSIQMLSQRDVLDDIINTKDIDTACKAALQYMDQFLVPNTDMIRYKLESKNVDYITKRAALEQLKLEITLKAAADMVSNSLQLEEQHKKVGFSDSTKEDIKENAVMFFAEQQKTRENADRPARQPLTAKERGAEDYKSFGVNAKRLQASTRQIVHLFTSSLVDLGRKVHPEVGALIQQVMWEHSKNVDLGQSHGKLFIKSLADYQKNIEIIPQSEYEENFVDSLNNYDVESARNWIATRFKDSKEKTDLLLAVDNMVDWMEGAKERMIALKVNPEAGWLNKWQYFPRSINDYEKFSDWLELGPKSIYEPVMSQSGIDVAKTAEQRQEAIYNMQQTFGRIARQGEHEGRIKMLHNRVIREVTPDMRQFYKDPIDAYMDYVKDVELTIMTRALIGSDPAGLEIDEDGNLRSINGAAKLFTVMHNKGVLYPGRIDTTGYSEADKERVKRKEEEVREFNKALNAFINRHKEHNRFFKFTNDILTITMLGHFSTALSQGQELITTALLFGAKNTFMATGDVLKGKQKLTIEDLHIDELEDAYKPLMQGTMEFVQNGVLKYTGFKTADVYFKNVAINAIYNFFQNALKNPGSAEYEKAKNMIIKSFGELKDFDSRLNTIMNDIANGNLSEDVKFLMYDVFSNQQPINAANISYGYNQFGALGRLCLFKFNTVAYRQCHALVEHFKQSFTTNNKFDAQKGLLEVLRFVTFCALIGIPLETIKNILNGNLDFNPKKDFVFSITQCFLLNEYDAKVASRDGFGQVVQNKLAAPLTPLNWVSQDVLDTYKMLKGKGTYTAKILKGVPGGRPIHSALYALAKTKSNSSGYNFNVINAMNEWGGWS